MDRKEKQKVRQREQTEEGKRDRAKEKRREKKDVLLVMLVGVRWWTQAAKHFSINLKLL